MLRYQSRRLTNGWGPVRKCLKDLYMSSDEQNFIIKTAPSVNLKINDKIKLFINLKNIHLFDEKSSESEITSD